MDLTHPDLSCREHGHGEERGNTS